MNIAFETPARPASFRQSGLRAFTLNEMMVVTAIFLLLVAALVSVQAFGLRLYRISETKLSSTAAARAALNQIRDEIRSARLIYVGNGSSNAFNVVADNSPQMGNALQIYPGTDTNHYVYYYMDAQSGDLDRKVSGHAAIQSVAGGVTNQFVFQAEDFQGNVLTNRQNNRVIRVSLRFYQKEYSTAPTASTASTASGGLYDYFQLQTRIAKRAIE